jgi:hypothetical protein
MDVKKNIDETTNATDIPFGTNIPQVMTIEIDLPSDVEKMLAFWPPAAILNF